MRATISFSDKQIVEVSGVDNIEHAEKVAHILASNFSAQNGVPIFASSISIDANNFICLPYPEFNMMGVKIESSVSGN
jgi:hypothetical protein